MFAPMPIASDATAASANPGARRRTRDGVPNVLPHLLHPTRPSRVAGALADRFEPAKRRERLPSSLGRGIHALGDEPIDLRVDVELELAIQIAFQPVRGESVS